MKRQHTQLSAIAMVLSLAAFMGLPTEAIPSETANAETEIKDFEPIAGYAKRYGVSLEEAAKRKARQRSVGRLGARLQNDHPDTYGGLYTEHRPIYRTIVQFTRNAHETLALYTNDPLYVAKTSRYSFNYLKAANSEIAESLARSGLVFETGLDVQNNRITVMVLDRAKALKYLKPLISKFPFIDIVEVPNVMRTTSDLRGGGKLLGHGSAPCTTGFNVVSAARELGVLTAGHCSESQTYMGDFFP